MIKWEKQGTKKYTIWVKIKQGQKSPKVCVYVCVWSLCKYAHKCPDTDLKRAITFRGGNWGPELEDKMSFSITLFCTVWIIMCICYLFCQKNPIKVRNARLITNLEVSKIFSLTFYATNICLKISEIK